MKKLLFSLTFIFSLQLFSQAPLEESMSKYYLDYLPEKIFVHTDKCMYAGGESLWMAVYLTDGYTHRPGTLSKLVRVELHDTEGKVVAEQKLYAEDGYSAGELALPASLKPGDYQLTAYTNYQRNSGNEMLFRKTVRVVPGLKESGSGSVKSAVPVPLNNEILESGPNLRFFPEGGDCVNGIPCRVAYVAEGVSGQPLEVEGHISNGDGAEITKMKTDEFGMGSFIYVPEAGRHYRAALMGTEKVFDLPPALEEGLHLTVQKRKNDIRLLLETSRPLGLVGARIGVHLRGFILVDQVLSTENNKAVLDLSLVNLSPGVYVATLFDQAGHPEAERLFFIPPHRGDNDLHITTDKAHYTTRQPVNLDVRMPIGDVGVDSLANGRVSLSVLPTEAGGGPSGDDIRTWLLLNSDMDRPIPYSPELLFASDTLTRDRRVDEFLLTRGWRWFRWEQAFGSGVFVPEHLLEMGLYLQGRMGKYESPKKPQTGTVILTQVKNGYFEERETDEMGNFVFGPFQVFDTLEVILQGRFGSAQQKQKDKEKAKKSNPYTHLEISGYKQPELPTVPFYQRNAPSKAQESEYADLSQNFLTVARNFDSLSITLDVVDVKAKRISPDQQERDERSSLYGGNPDSRIIVDSLPSGIPFTVFDLLRRMPGVRVTGSYGNESIEIRGKTSILLSSEPAYYVDGFQVDIEYIRFLQAADIEFVDVILGARAAILGGRRSKWAVMFYSRTGGTQTQKGSSPGVLKTNIFGFHKARQFAVFDQTQPGNQNRPDLRTTLHWYANRPIDVNGAIRETFTTSDQKGNFIIVAQGLRNDGRPYYGTAEFEVE